MLCACVFTPQQTDSSVLIKTERNEEYDTYGYAQQGAIPSEVNTGINHDKTRHARHQGNTTPGHSHITDVDDDESIEPGISKTLDSLPDHTSVDSVHSDDSLDDTINEIDDETLSSNSKTLANLAGHAQGDEITEKYDELNEKEILSEQSDLEQEENEQKHVREQTKECPKCNKEISERQVNIEMIKQHLLQKLGLSVAPKVDGPLPPLPFDFYAGEDFSVNDEDIKVDEEKARSNVKTRQIFIFGEDSEYY